MSSSSITIQTAPPVNQNCNGYSPRDLSWPIYPSLPLCDLHDKRRANPSPTSARSCVEEHPANRREECNPIHGRTTSPSRVGIHHQGQVQRARVGDDTKQRTHIIAGPQVDHGNQRKCSAQQKRGMMVSPPASWYPEEGQKCSS